MTKEIKIPSPPKRGLGCLWCFLSSVLSVIPNFRAIKIIMAKIKDEIANEIKKNNIHNHLRFKSQTITSADKSIANMPAIIMFNTTLGLEGSKGIYGSSTTLR